MAEASVQHRGSDLKHTVGGAKLGGGILVAGAGEKISDLIMGIP